MQRDHQSWRARLRRRLRAQCLGRATQNGEGPLAGITQFGAGRKWNASLEHCRVISGLGPCEFKIRLAHPIERGEWLRPTFVPRLLERNRELFESAQRDAAEKFIAVAEMPIRRGRAHACPPRGLGKGEARRSFLRDQFQSGAEQRFFQVAVVITARPTAPAMPRPAHVNSSYMSRGTPSMRRPAAIPG